MPTNSATALKQHTTFSDFLALTKVRLAISVVVSTLAGYALGVENFNLNEFYTLILLAIGGYCMVGASNVYNQIIEKDLDAKMDRTKNRPLPANRVTTTQAFILGTLLTVLGIAILYYINQKTALFAAISIFMYVSMYTPLKTITPLSVFVGAFPGAIPFMLGWVAATGNFGIEAGTLFIIQFFWQFPHFWAIAWFLDEDYKKADFKMLPTGKTDKKSALQTVIYTVWTILASLLPFYFSTGKLKLSVVAAVIILLLGLWMFFASLKLYKEMSRVAARKLMLVSVSYISLLQLVYVLDKFLR